MRWSGRGRSRNLWHRPVAELHAPVWKWPYFYPHLAAGGAPWEGVTNRDRRRWLRAALTLSLHVFWESLKELNLVVSRAFATKTWGVEIRGGV